MKKQIIFNFKKNKTKIIIKSGYVKKYIRNLIDKKDNKLFFIIDSKLKNNFNFLKNNNSKFIYINGNEKIKNIKNYYEICENLFAKGIDRNCKIIAIGGGTVGDLIGFVASTILRGVKFHLIPTTLLSQVDSSIGGKNGINTKYGKNLIGSFYHPDEVMIDPKLLITLPVREIKSGYAEIIKHAIINDKHFFNWLGKNKNKILDKNFKLLEKAIYKSIIIKGSYIKSDVNEKLQNKYSRSILNFGHTIGHALETSNNYNNKINHGEAISVGMIIEAKLSQELGYLNSFEFNKILSHFKEAGLKTNLKFKTKDLIKIINKDKKNYNDKINIILIRKIGKAFYKKNLEKNKLNKFLNLI